MSDKSIMTFADIIHDELTHNNELKAEEAYKDFLDRHSSPFSRSLVSSMKSGDFEDIRAVLADLIVRIEALEAKL